MAATVAMGPSTVDRLMAARGEVLRLVSALSGFPSDAVTTVPNTSTGLFRVALALTGEVLVGAREFPANRYPWARAEEAGLLTVRTLPATTPASVAAALGPAGTAVTVTVHAAQVRVAVHASTGPESADLLLDVLARA